MINNQDNTPHEDELLYTPKKNWHVRKKWNDGKRARNAIKSWYISNNEEIELSPNGIPILIWPYKENTGEYTYKFTSVYFYNNIEKKWFHKYRHRNGQTDGLNIYGYWHNNTFITGKSSREGMREKARWWQQAEEYLENTG